MPMTYQAGSTLPTNANISTLLAQTIANSKPNDLQIIIDALNNKGINPYDAVATQVTITNSLP